MTGTAVRMVLVTAAVAITGELQAGADHDHRLVQQAALTVIYKAL
jgi:hypothetical protein